MNLSGMLIRKFFLFNVFLLTLYTVSGQDSTEIRIWQNVEALNKAIFVNKDSATLKMLIDKRVSYGHSGGNIEDKNEMIRKAVQNLNTYRNVSTEKISIEVIKNTAIVRHKLHATQKDKDGIESQLKLGILQVWIKTKYIWKLVARQAVKLQ